VLFTVLFVYVHEMILKFLNLGLEKTNTLKKQHRFKSEKRILYIYYRMA